MLDGAAASLGATGVPTTLGLITVLSSFALQPVTVAAAVPSDTACGDGCVFHVSEAGDLTQSPPSGACAANCINLDLEDKGITSIAPDTFTGLDLVEKIKLKGNFITIIKTGTFTNLAAVTWIGMEKNVISNIETGAFVNVPELDQINLQNQPSSLTLTAGMFAGPSGYFVVYTDEGARYIFCSSSSNT